MNKTIYVKFEWNTDNIGSRDKFDVQDVKECMTIYDYSVPPNCLKITKLDLNQFEQHIKKDMIDKFGKMLMRLSHKILNDNYKSPKS